ncbi:MAG TPA: hypothetical protein VFU21_18550 [Kofleriaceae bacterium]|nr:hypothetical protein [Kofleriaceae bacterium]
MRIALAAAAVLAAGACSGQSSGDPDASPWPDATELVCDEGGGEPFDLAMGYLSDSAFVELVDGDEAMLVLGAQGIYMLHLESRALVSLTSEQVCFTCRIQVGPTEAGFAGTELDGPVGFVQVGAGAFGGAVNVLLGSRETSDAFADAAVDVAMQCDGNGFSGAVDRSVVLRLPPS